MENFLAANEPTRGQRGKELPSHVTDHDSANMQTAHGVLQGYHSHALVDAQSQVIVQAETFGHGQDYGPVAPMLDGAKANVKAMGLPEEYVEGQILSADSHDHREVNLKTCAHAKLEAYSPAPHVRQRDPRCATHERHTPPPEEHCTREDFAYDPAHDCYICPHGRWLKLEAHRPKIGKNIYRRDEAAAVDCGGCVLRENC
jgi:hypothetical protein